MRSQAEWLGMNNWPVVGLILEDEHKVEQKTWEAAVGEWAAFIENETDQNRWVIKQMSPLVSEEGEWMVHQGRSHR